MVSLHVPPFSVPCKETVQAVFMREAIRKLSAGILNSPANSSLSLSEEEGPNYGRRGKGQKGAYELIGTWWASCQILLHLICMSV